MSSSSSLRAGRSSEPRDGDEANSSVPKATIPSIVIGQYDNITKTEASVILDGGDAEHLEHSGREQIRSVSRLDQSDEDCLAPRPGEAVTTKLSEPDLQTLIRRNVETSVGSKEPNFLPINKLDMIMNQTNLKKALKQFKPKPGNINEIIHEIWNISSSKTYYQEDPVKTTRRRLFATLLLMDETRKIIKLIKENIFDCDLPFFKGEGGRLHKKSQGGILVQIESFQDWRPRDHDSFYTYQWQILAPYWAMSSEENPQFKHYVLDDKVILPFMPLENHDEQQEPDYGGFSSVYKVKIHDDHHNLPPPLSPTQHRLFAVKKLNSEDRRKFDAETKNLKRIGAHNHVHVIRALVSFEHGSQYHWIFPWADGNLFTYWSKIFPLQDSFDCDEATVLWLATQFSGLASALALIHYCPLNSAHGPELEPHRDQILGRHGDLKPENILWFEHGGKGTLQIADFGLADFHRDVSRDQPASRAGQSKTYRSPECDAVVVDQSSDIWSFGCVLLEFITWYLCRWRGVEEFCDKRLGVGKVYREDCFFESDKHIEGDSVSLRHKVSNAVIEQFAYLRTLERCSAFFGNVLDIIENHLLKSERSDRWISSQLSKELETLKSLCDDNPSFCLQRKDENGTSDVVNTKQAPGFKKEETASTTHTSNTVPIDTQNTVYSEAIYTTTEEIVPKYAPPIISPSGIEPRPPAMEAPVSVEIPLKDNPTTDTLASPLAPGLESGDRSPENPDKGSFFRSIKGFFCCLCGS